jgi:hypothetical protein
MEMQSIVIFALIGALCMFIVTGGALSMASDATPEPSTLVGGAAVGGALGAAARYFMTADMSSIGSLSSLVSTATPDMKVGLPSF